MAKRITYHVITYGEWTRPRLRNFREQCCDCGLIHRLDFRVVDGRIDSAPGGTTAPPPPPAAASSSRRTNERRTAMALVSAHDNPERG
jgi:hypothetical protein